MTRGIIHSVASTSRYMFVVTANNEIFFLHFNNIQKGAAKVAPGAYVVFDPVSPLPGKKYQMAVNAIVTTAAAAGADLVALATPPAPDAGTSDNGGTR